MKWFFDFLHSKKCLFCGELLTDKKAEICDNCARRKIPLMGVPVSPIVGRTGRKTLRYYDYAYSCYSYKGSVRYGILACKFHGRKKTYKYLAKDLERLFRDTPRLHSAQAVIPVPLSRKRLRERGFNQCEILTDYLSDRLGLENLKNVLVRERHGEPQSKIADVSARKTNIKGAYIVKHKEKLVGKTVLLVDDVITSGATVNECAKTLKKAGAARVFCISIAKA